MVSKTNRPGRSPDFDLFDDSVGYDGSSGVKLADSLTEQERKQASTLYRLFNELWGLCLILGDPGAGKDVFGNYLLYTVKRYFPGKRILRDERPRRLFGPYDGLFNEAVIQSDLKKMRDFAKGVQVQEESDDYSNAFGTAVDDWIKNGRGKVLLHNGVTFMTEFWRYCPRREPHKPMNKTMGGIFKEKRHIDTLFIATTQLYTELDRFTCLPWVDWRVTCTRSKIDTTKYTFFVEKVDYDRRKDLLISISRPFAIPVDAGKPRSYMGDGKITIRKPNYQPETEEERVVLTALKAGINCYEDLVAALEDGSDMSEWETLSTVKDLGLKLPNKRPKFAIDYPCVYHLFNSKSAPQMKSSVRSEGD